MTGRALGAVAAPTRVISVRAEGNRDMHHIKHIPLFPIFPIVPIALVFTSIGLSIAALVRVHRLNARVATAGVTFGAE